MLLIIFIIKFTIIIIYYKIIHHPKYTIYHQKINTKHHILNTPNHNLFQNLTKNKTQTIKHYLYSNKTFNFTKKKFTSNFYYLYNIKLLLPNKTSTLKFLNSLNNPKPPKKIHIILFHNNKSPPIIKKYTINPLNNIKYHHLITSTPYKFKPISSIKNQNIQKLIKQINFTLKFILKKTFKTNFFHYNSQYLTLNYYTPISPTISNKNKQLI